MRLFDVMLKIPVPAHPLTRKPCDVIADLVSCVDSVDVSSAQPVSAAANMPSTTPLIERYLFMTYSLDEHNGGPLACDRSEPTSPRRASREGCLEQPTCPWAHPATDADARSVRANLTRG